MIKRLFVSFMFLLVAIAPAQPAPNGAAQLEGQIVCCAECWAEADRRTVAYGTSADLTKAAQCAANGDPTLLAVMNAEGRTTFYQLENGRFGRPGENWLAFVGNRVRITGRVSAERDRNYLRVDALEVLSRPDTTATATPETNVIGTEVELELLDLTGAGQRLSALRGRIVVLNFWATWCVPCRREMPDLVAIQNEYAALGVQVIGASADAPDARQNVLQFVRETRINFPVWLGATTAEMTRFGLGEALPGTIIIGRDGKIVSVTRGIVRQEDLRRQIDALIAQATAQAETEAATNNQVARARTEARPGDVSAVPS